MTARGLRYAWGFCARLARAAGRALAGIRVTGGRTSLRLVLGRRAGNESGAEPAKMTTVIGLDYLEPYSPRNAEAPH